MSDVRHVLHIDRVPENGEWQAWCCCGWESYAWRLKDSAQVAVETHMAAVNSGVGVEGKT